jgi:ubiquinone/menaquinone biosynthesis C-methylase UbiE
VKKLSAHARVQSEDPLLSPQQPWINLLFKNESGFWRDVYQLQDVYAVIHQLRRSTVLGWVDELHLPPESQVLEVGCGAGGMTVALARRGYVVTALDSVPAMLAETRRLARKTGSTKYVKTARVDVHDISIKANTFSLVLALGVIPWLQSPRKALEEMARVLKPGGFLMINSDNRWRLNSIMDPFRFPPLMRVRRRFRRVLERWGLWNESPSGSRSRPHSMHEFDDLLAGAMLEKERGKTLGFGPFTFLNYPLFSDSKGVRLHKRLQGLADRQFPFVRSTGCQYLVLARKRVSDFGGAHKVDGSTTSGLSV